MSKSRTASFLQRSAFAVRRLCLCLLALVAHLFVAPTAPVLPRRILVIKPDHLGDVLLATPALRLLRRQHPQAHVVALVGPWSVFILARNPHVDTVLTLPFPGFTRTEDQAPRANVIGRVLGSWFSVLRPYGMLFHYAALLRAGGFDTALLLRDDHWWGAALALLAGIPRRVGYAVPECRPFLTTALPWKPDQHVAEQALAVIHELSDWRLAIGLRDTSIAGLRFEPAQADRQWAATWLQQRLAPGERLVVVHPGTGGPAKLWLPARWVAVGDALAALPGVRLLITGGPGEEALVATIAAQMQRPSFTMVGTMSVGQLAALLGQAALALGVDSGPLHLAVSQGTPSLHLFGPSDARRFGPWGDPARHVVLRAGLWCSPCGVFSACPRHTDPPECMERIAVGEVVAAAQRLLHKDV